MKYLALILFTFELIAPVCVAGISTEGCEKYEIQLSTATAHQNPLSPLLLELNESEEEKDGHKSPFAGSDCSSPEHLLSFDIHRVEITSYINLLQQFRVSPALFQVHCKFQI